MKLVPIKEYAEKHKRALRTVQQKAQYGGFETAVKLGPNWFINIDEPYIDRRFTDKREIVKP